MGRISRIFRHMAYPQWRIGRAFPKSALAAIEAEVGASEKTHSGELRFVVEGGLDLPELLRGLTARERAVEAFSQLHVWDTEHNSGVLIYVQLADRQVEILADRGINKKVSGAVWQGICDRMEQSFRAGKFREGGVAGVQAVGRVLAEHFPAEKEDQNELKNEPVVL